MNAAVEPVQTGVSVVGVIALVAAYLWVVSLVGRFARWGEAREAARTFEADFIAENADVLAQERRLLEAQLLSGLRAVEVERKRLNRTFRAVLS